MLADKPAFTCIAVACIAIGIGDLFFVPYPNEPGVDPEGLRRT